MKNDSNSNPTECKPARILEYSVVEANKIAHFINGVNWIQSKADGEVRKLLDKVMEDLPESVYQKAFSVSDDKCFKEWEMVNGVPVYSIRSK